jgi:hypothetical protein
MSSNTSIQYEQQLHSLGAITSQVLHENLTHYVCENVSIKRILAARLLNVTVVSPLWIAACRDAAQRVEEVDFGLTSELVELIASIDGSSADVVPVMSEPAAQLTNALRALDSPFFPSSSSAAQTQLTQASASLASAADAERIPLPAFRPYSPPKAMPGELTRRRSDRIIDKGGSDDDYDWAAQSIRNEMRDCAASEAVRTDEPMPILFTRDAADDALQRFDSTLRDESAADAERRRGRRLGKHCVGSSSALSSNATRSAAAKSLATTATGSAPPPPPPLPPPPLPSGPPPLPSRTAKGNGADALSAASWPVPSAPVAPAVARAPAFRPPSPFVLALSGFDKADGEHASTLRMLKDLKQSIAAAGAVAGGRKQSRAAAVAVEIVEDDDDVAADFACLVVPRDCQTYGPPAASACAAHVCSVLIAVSVTCRRTLRILFALARGRSVVSEDWLYASLCETRWVDPAPHVLPRFRCDADVDANAALGAFRGKTFCVLHSSRPAPQVLRALVAAAGGATSDELLQHPAHDTPKGRVCCVVGDSEDLRLWLRRQAADATDGASRVSLLKELMAHGVQVVTCKFVFNCLEERCWRYALKKAGESLSPVDVANIEDAVRAELAASRRRSDKAAARKGRGDRAASSSAPAAGAAPVPAFLCHPAAGADDEADAEVALGAALLDKLHDAAALTAADFVDESQHDAAAASDVAHAADLDDGGAAGGDAAMGPTPTPSPPPGAHASPTTSDAPAPGDSAAGASASPSAVGGSQPRGRRSMTSLTASQSDSLHGAAVKHALSKRQSLSAFPAAAALTLSGAAKRLRRDADADDAAPPKKRRGRPPSASDDATMVTGASDDERSDSDFSSISPRDGHLLDSCAASFAFTQTSVAAASQPPPPRPPPQLQLQRSPSPPPREATAQESSLLQFVIGWFSSKTTPVRSPATAAKGAAPALPNTQTAVDALAALSGAKPDATLVSSGGPAERTLVPDDDNDDSGVFVVRRSSVRPRSALLADEGDNAVEDDDGGADDYDALVRSPGRGLSPEPRRSTVRAAERTRPAASRLKKRLF